MPRKLFYEINGVRNHFFLVLLLALQACAAPRFHYAEVEDEQVFATLEPFYAGVLAGRFYSLPSDKERAELADFLMPELIQLLKDAEEIEDRCVETAPEGNKPLIVEGSIFVDNFEGATEVAYGKIKTGRYAEGVVTLSVILTSIVEGAPKAHRFRAHSWNEEVELRRKDGKWLINNINFPNSSNPGLRFFLQDYISSGRQECVSRRASS